MHPSTTTFQRLPRPSADSKGERRGVAPPLPLLLLFRRSCFPGCCRRQQAGCTEAPSTAACMQSRNHLVSSPVLPA